MTEQRKLALRQVLVVALLFSGYASYYFCRADLSVAMPMIEDELRGIGVMDARVRLGTVVSLGVVAYAAGKILLGVLGDLWGGRRSFLGGFVGAIVFTLLFALGGGLPIFTLAWVGNRLIQSMGWSGLVKVCSQWFSFKSYGIIVGILSLSYLIGDAVAREWMGAIIAGGHGWRSVFYLAAIVTGVIFAANVFWLKETRSTLGFSEAEENPLNVFQAKSDSGQKPGDLLLPLIQDRGFLIVCVLSFLLTIVRETFNAWTPTYLHTFFGYTNSAAASMSGIFPALGAVSVVAAGLLGDRLGPHGRAVVMFLGMLVCALGLSLLCTLQPGAQGALPLVLIGVVGLGLLGPYSYLSGALALDFGGKKAGATSSGLIDGIGYIGGILAGDGVARLSVRYGWRGVFVVLAVVSCVSALAAALLFVHQRQEVRLRQLKMTTD